MRLRILQTSPILGDVDTNLAMLDAAVASAVDSDLIVTPELATHGYDLGAVPGTLPLDLSDSRVQRIGGHGPAVLLGCAERARHGQHNSAVLLGTGDQVVQRKLVPPTYRGWEELKHFIPGGRVRTAEVAGTTVATLICNDIWQPQLAWIAAQQGAEVLLAPANSVISEVGLPTATAWERQLRGLAISLQSYIVFVNRTGTEPCGTFWGGSTVYGPDGEVLARAGAGEEVLDVELDIAALRAARFATPLLRTSRADVVVREAQRLLEREADDV